MNKILSLYKKNFQKRDKVGFYEFILFMGGIELNYKEMELMENLIALYEIKNPMDMMKMRFTEFEKRNSKNSPNHNAFPNSENLS